MSNKLVSGAAYNMTCINNYQAFNPLGTLLGDGFTAFRGGTNVTRIGVSDLDALIEYVQFLYGVPPNNTPIDPAVYPAIERRITNVTP